MLRLLSDYRLWQVNLQQHQSTRGEDQDEDEDLDVVVEDQDVQNQNQAEEQDLDHQNLADKVQKTKVEDNKVQTSILSSFTKNFSQKILPSNSNFLYFDQKVRNCPVWYCPFYLKHKKMTCSMYLCVIKVGSSFNAPGNKRSSLKSNLGKPFLLC